MFIFHYVFVASVELLSNKTKNARLYFSTLRVDDSAIEDLIKLAKKSPPSYYYYYFSLLFNNSFYDKRFDEVYSGNHIE